MKLRVFAGPRQGAPPARAGIAPVDDASVGGCSGGEGGEGLALAEARARAHARFSVLATERLHPADACGRVLAEALLVTEPVPAFTSSAMDGYAFRSADSTEGRVRLRVTGTVLAGDGHAHNVGPGEAMRIMTGAPLPGGADVVCTLEASLVLSEGFVEIPRAFSPFENVREAGEELRPGDELFPAGTALGASAIGALASLGIDPVPVVAAPRVGVLSTGDELVETPGPTERGEIRDVNRPALLARIRCDGFAAVDLGIVADDEDLLVEVLEAATSSCEAIVVSAGASRGDRDLTVSALRRIGQEVEELRVALRPGRPLALASVGPQRTPVLGLAGNPVAAMVAYELFVRPGLRRQAGFSHTDRPLLAARASAPYPRPADGTVHLAPVQVAVDGAGRLRVEGWAPRGSHRIHALARCNGLAVVPDGAGIERGDAVGVLLIEEPVQAAIELATTELEVRRAG